MRRAILACTLAALPLCEAVAYPLLYAEDFYELYHRHFNEYPDDLMENLVWLERALGSDFRNPLYALARVEDEVAWKRYRELFRMHVNLEIIKVYRTFGSKYQKFTAYFYNYPWKRQNLESLEQAEILYRQAYHYWEEAERHAEEAWRYRAVHLQEVQAWEDESYRIVNGELDYGRILDRDMARIEKVRRDFEAMGPDTY